MVRRGTRGAIAVPINTAYKGQYLRHQLGDSGAKVVVVQRTLADRVARGHRRSARARARDRGRRPRGAGRGAGDRDRRRRSRCTSGTRCWRRRRHDPTVTIRPSDLATFIYTGGTTGPSKGCMLSHNYHEALARQIGICWERTADDVVWTPLAAVPLQRARDRGARLARVRRSRCDLPPVLGVELLAGDEPRRRDDHVDARHDGLPARARHRPARDAELGRARGEHVAAAARRGAVARGGRQPHPRALRCRDVQRRVRPDRSEPRLVAAARRAQQAERGRRAEHRVLRRPPVRRRREGSRAGREGRDRRPAEAPARDVRGLLGPARGDRRGDAATSGSTPATSPGSTRTASSSSSTASRTTSGGAARTSRASRSRASSWATARSPTSPCARCRAR